VIKAQPDVLTRSAAEVAVTGFIYAQAVLAPWPSSQLLTAAHKANFSGELLRQPDTVALADSVWLDKPNYSGDQLEVRVQVATRGETAERSVQRVVEATKSMAVLPGGATSFTLVSTPEFRKQTFSEAITNLAQRVAAVTPAGESTRIGKGKR